MSTELSLEEIHAETLSVIEEIDRICSEIGIKYVTFFGSLIGAIRHKGFIPWDDDFDIVMLRPDYDIFVEYCNKYVNDKGFFRLMDKDNTPGYPFNVARFCDLNYRLVMESDDSNIEMGLFVDVYPLDAVGSNVKKAHRRIEWKQQLYNIGWSCALHGTPPDTQRGLLAKIVKKIVYIWAKNKSPYYFFRKYDSLAQLFPYDSSTYVSVVIWGVRVDPMPKEWFENTIEVPFESIKVKVPKEYDKALTARYGDYLKLPPPEKRCPTHAYSLYRREE